jgi:hypothetical protein
MRRVGDASKGTARIINGKAVRTRLTLRQVSPDSAIYNLEMGARGGPMKVVMEGRQTRLK